MDVAETSLLIFRCINVGVTACTICLDSEEIVELRVLICRHCILLCSQRNARDCDVIFDDLFDLRLQAGTGMVVQDEGAFANDSNPGVNMV